MKTMKHERPQRKGYYAVWSGSTEGIFTSWTDCSESVIGYSGAGFKKFSTLSEAINCLLSAGFSLNDIVVHENAEDDPTTNISETERNKTASETKYEGEGESECETMHGSFNTHGQELLVEAHAGTCYANDSVF